MNARTQRPILRGNSWLQLVCVVAIVVLGNLLANDHFARWDLTQDQAYTLHPSARGLMDRVDRPLIVRVFFSRGLEAPYNNNEQVVVDKLEEFRAWSGGQMEVVVVDPTGDEELMELAHSLGIDPLDYTYQGGGVVEMRQVYMGAALVYGDQVATLPSLKSVATIEYDLARTIKNLVDGDQATIGYVTGHGEPDLLTGKGPVATLRANLQAQYTLQAVDLAAPEGISPTVDALLVIGPNTELSTVELYALDQFVMSGRPTALFVSNHRIDLRPPIPSIALRHGMEPLIGAYGVELNRDVVVDRQNNGKIRFPVRQGSQTSLVPLNVPYVPVITDLADDSVVVKDLESMTFPFVSSIDVPETQPEGVTVEVLARSGRNTGRIKSPKSFDPRAYGDRPVPSEEVGAWPVMVSVRGPIDSAFAGRDAPETAVGPRMNQAQDARVVVAGSADFIANNITFMLNLVDWMVQDEDLIAIRSKQVRLAEIRDTSKQEQLWLKLGNLLGASALLLIFGAVRLVLRGRGGGPTRESEATP